MNIFSGVNSTLPADASGRRLAIIFLVVIVIALR